MAVNFPSASLPAPVLYPSDKTAGPVRDNFARSFLNDFHRTKMDDGQFRQRRIYVQQPEKSSLTWKFTWAQLQMFEGFVEYDLDGGSAWFDLALSPAVGSRSYKFLAPGPVYTFDESSGQWMVTVDVESLADTPTVQSLSYYPLWPASLPEPERAGYTYAVPDHITFGNVEGGEPGSRRRFTDKLTSYKASWILDQAQFETFMRFVTADLADGLAYFSAPFSNGMGYGLVKARFTSPPVYNNLGSSWTVAAQLETTQAPLISEVIYRLGGKLRFDDAISLTDLLNILRTGVGLINDRIVLQDQMARMLRMADAATLKDAIFKKDRTPVADAVGFIDMLRMKLNLARIDNLALVDAIKISYTKRLADTLSLKDQTATATSYKKLFTDAINQIADAIANIDSMFFKPIIDGIQPYDSGLACWNDYAVDYVDDSYVATCVGWSNLAEIVQLQELLSIDSTRGYAENITLQETLALLTARPLADSFDLAEDILINVRNTRIFEDVFSMSTSGGVIVQDYANDYVEDQYVGNTVPFLN